MDLERLEALASAGRMIPDAPVLGSRHVVIDAPAETIWKLLVDVPRWPSWYDYLRGAEITGAFHPGARIRYGGAFGHRLHLAAVDRHKLVMIYGTYMGYSAITRWDLQPAPGGGTRVDFTESSVGFLIGVLYGGDKLGGHLARWLAALKRAAEAR